MNLEEVDTPPIVIRKPQLVYPKASKDARAQGVVLLNLLINEKGDVADVKLIQGSPGFGLNDAALDHAKRYKYRPAQKGNVPVKVWMPLQVRFQIN